MKRMRQLFALLVALLTFTTMTATVAASSHAVVTVDPGVSVSAGKTIIGSGQNLPTLDSASSWNIGPQAEELVNDYYTKGGVATDRRKVTTSAREWTKSWLKKTCGDLRSKSIKMCNAAAVFDIDETLLTSHSIAATNDPAFSYNPVRSLNAEQTCQTPVIRSTRNLLNTFRSWGLDIYVITGRGEKEREATVSCLMASGISGWKELIMKQPEDTTTAAIYKANARQRIESTGTKIGPSVGDQVSDMSFGHLERGFLIPNVMYFIP